MSDPNENNIVDPRPISENLEAEKKNQDFGSLIIWLAIAIVCAVVIFLVFRVFGY